MCREFTVTLYVFNNIKEMNAVPNNHTPPDDDIERNLCAELFVVVDLAHFIIIIFFFCDLNLRFLNLRVH